MLRLTAKSTQFGLRTFTSWLIESAGTIPIKRRKDFASDDNVDNSEAMEKLMEVKGTSYHYIFSSNAASFRRWSSVMLSVSSQRE
jgi:hypothetical protein